jgi:hypothetical protein
MSKHYSPRHFFRKVSNELLKQYFVRKDLLIDIDFTALKEGKIEPIYEAWLALPADIRNDMEQDFQEVHDMASEGGSRIILEIANLNGENLASQFAKLKGFYDHAFWTFLEYPQYWADILIFNHADSMRQSYWNKYKNFPLDIKIKDECIKILEQRLGEYFHSTQGRGKNCKVDRYKRNDRAYFFAYPEDYAQSDAEWDSEVLKRRSRHPAFEVIFVYSPTDGTLDICMPGGRKILPELQRIFCEVVLGVPFNTSEKNERIYNLAPLLSRGFPFSYTAESGILDVTIKKFRFDLYGRKERLTIEANALEGKYAIFDLLDKITRAIPLYQMTLNQVKLKVTFIHSSKPTKIQTRCFDITSPNTCSLKHTDKDRIIRQVLIDSGIELTSHTNKENSTHEQLQPTTTTVT